MANNGARRNSGQRKTVCVIGADDYNLELIRRAPGADAWNLVPVLQWTDLQPPSGRIDFNDLYERATETIEALGDGPDAIICYLDFPATSLAALLARDYGVRAADPRAVACCEHKYWMRAEQKKRFPEETPEFRALNPFAPEQAMKEALPFPFWLKPVKGHSSVLGFMVEDRDDLEEALHVCRQQIHLIGGPFNQFLTHAGVMDELDGVDGNFAVAEALISAKRQFTLEGFVYRGETVVYGAVDSLREGKFNSSFSRYQYPADLPDSVLSRAEETTAAMLEHIGYDDAPFNIEFFWNPETDALHLLEINPRISKSHSPLFHMVDGSTHHKVAIELSLGRKPRMPSRKGKDQMAGKFMLRSYEPDGIVRRVPSKQEIAELERILPDIDANVLVGTGQRLSELAFQDSYSYELADIFLGGNTEEMLEDAYARCLDSLPIYIQPLPKAT